MSQEQFSKQLVEDYRLTFSSAHGRRVLRDLVANNYLSSSMFDPRLPREAIFVHEGMRNAILRILTILNLNEAGLVSIIGENEDERREAMRQAPATYES